MIRVVHPGSGCWLSPIPDPRVKKAPNPGSGSATLLIRMPVAKFLSPWPGDKVDPGIGLSYPLVVQASQPWRASSTTTLCQSWLYNPSQRLWIWLQESLIIWTSFSNDMDEITIKKRHQTLNLVFTGNCLLSGDTVIRVGVFGPAL